MMVKMMTKALSQIGPSENLAKVKVIARSYLSALTNCNNNVADDGGEDNDDHDHDGEENDDNDCGGHLDDDNDDDDDCDCECGVDLPPPLLMFQIKFLFSRTSANIGLRKPQLLIEDDDDDVDDDVDDDDDDDDAVLVTKMAIIVCI